MVETRDLLQFHAFLLCIVQYVHFDIYLKNMLQNSLEHLDI